MVAKTRAAIKSLSAAFAQREVKKTYMAIVGGLLDGRGSIEVMPMHACMRLISSACLQLNLCACMRLTQHACMRLKLDAWMRLGSDHMHTCDWAYMHAYG